MASAAGGALELYPRLVKPALAQGWQVAVTLTPTAGRWFTEAGLIEEIEQATGLPVRIEPRLPSEPRPHPQVDCYVVAPATANTVAKLAMGFADSQALTQVGEALGMPTVPVVVFPCVNRAHTRHPMWDSHIQELRAAGVHLIYGEQVWPLPESRSMEYRALPWDVVLATAANVVRASTCID